MHSQSGSQSICPPSPGDLFLVAEKPSRRTVLGQGRKPYGRFCALRNAPRRTLPTHIGLHPAGAHRVHLDIALPDIGGRSSRECIKRRLRQTVCSVTAGHFTQLPKAGRQIDDPAVALVQHPRQNRLSESEWTNGIDVKALKDLIDRHFDHISGGTVPATLKQNTGIIDENIDAAEQMPRAFLPESR